uniref:Tc1-like transposase n=1 Tax=Drosophila pseudoobscura pseudoobscura TaxID=46245 RepID=Q86PR2_DROPS|nr:Tc1-like transposase [Drosophila pseudoobscura]
MVKTKELSVETRSEIVTKFKSGVSASELAKTYKICRKTVYNLEKKKDTNGNLQNLKRSGRKQAMDERECRRLIGIVDKNPSISPVKLSAHSQQLIGKKVCDATIRRRLKEIDIRTYTVRKIIEISEANKAKRLSFALEYVKKPKEFWYNVLWTDEVAFQFQGSFCKRFMHLRQAKKQSAVQPLNRFGGGTVMFWGCMSYYGFGDFVPIEGTLNQTRYLVILNEHAFVSGDRLFPISDWILQQDNAPCHKGSAPTKFLRDLNVAVLPWPAQSPDLNIIENVWSLIKGQRTIDKNRKRDVTIEEVKEIWSKLELGYARHLVESVPARLQAVIDAKGGITKY